MARRGEERESGKDCYHDGSAETRAEEQLNEPWALLTLQGPPAEEKDIDAMWRGGADTDTFVDARRWPLVISTLALKHGGWYAHRQVST